MWAHSRLCSGPVGPLSPDRPSEPQRVVRGETSPTPRPPAGSASPRDASRSARRQAARSFRSGEKALLKTAPRLSTETYSATRNSRNVDKSILRDESLTGRRAPGRPCPVVLTSARRNPAVAATLGPLSEWGHDRIDQPLSIASSDFDQTAQLSIDVRVIGVNQ
jgi:hypothetical protein